MASNEVPEGLSSQTAQKRLVEELDSLISKSTNVNWCKEIARNPFTTICSALSTMGGILLVIYFAVSAEEGTFSILFQGLMLVFLSAFNICLFGWEVYILRTQKIRHLIVRLKPVFDSPCPWTTSDYPKSSISTLRGNLTIPAYRDGSLVNVPISLLVSGDVIELDSGVPCPANATMLTPTVAGTAEHVAVDEVLSDDFFGERPPECGNDSISFLPEAKPVRLVVEDSPILTLLKVSMKKGSASSFLTKETNYVFCVMYVSLIAATYLVSLVFNCVRYFSLQDDFSESWPELIFGCPVYTCLPVLFLQLPLVWSFTNLYGTARIAMLVENGPCYFQAKGLGKIRAFLQTLATMAKLVVLFSRYPDYRVFHVLGTLTSVCAVDKEYVLAGGFPSPERVLFLRTEPVAADDTPKVDIGVGKQPHFAEEEPIFPAESALGIKNPVFSACAESALDGDDSPLSPDLGLDDDDDDVMISAELARPAVRVEISSTPDMANSGRGKSHDDTASSGCSKSHDGKSHDDKSHDDKSHDDKSGDIDRLCDSTSCMVAEYHLVVTPDVTPDISPGCTTTSIPISSQVDTVSTLSAFSDSAPFELITEIFNISPDPTALSGIAFDEVYWQDHIGSLKPIGVNLLTTSHLSKVPFYLSPSGSCSELQLHLHKSSCSCSLSLEIGVTEYSTQNFSREFLVHSISDPNMDVQRASRRRSTATTFVNHNNSIHPHMISSVVKECESGKSLVMSRGSGDLIASCCSDFWDGQELQPMTTTERSSIIDYYNCRSLSSYCIALSYSPVLNADLSCLDRNEIGIYVPPSYLEQAQDNTSPTANILTGRRVAMSPAELTFASLQSGQVFLGLVCLQFRPKQDVVALIEDLYTAGIRFVHFTAENEVRGKIFAQKLGLEADWNCFVSLAHPVEDDMSSLDGEDSDGGSGDSSLSSSVLSFFNSTMSNKRARLPEGIKQIRPHIEKVDNVPLLVSLFTNCTAETVTEMIEIMQDNSEVVLCLGNAWNHKNVSIFSQADVSLSLVPRYLDLSSCTVTETCALSTSTSSQNASSIHWHGKGGWPSPLELASYLNSASCQLCFGRENNVSLLSLITESRRILSSVRQGLLFGLGASLTLSLLLLLATVFFLPPPLNGSHLFWLFVFTIPLITISFLATPLDPAVRSVMPDKKKDLFSNKFLILVEFVVLFGSTAVVLITMFGLALTEICISDITNSTCHHLLGNRQDGVSPWNGWGRGGEAEQGFLLAQNVTAFFTAFYLVVLSVKFVHRTQPLWRLWRFISWQYILVTSTAVLLQVLFCVLSQLIDEWRGNLVAISSLASIPASVWSIGVLWPPVAMVLSEILKHIDKKKLFEAQTLLRLQFGTKLGMHSPV